MTKENIGWAVVIGIVGVACYKLLDVKVSPNTMFFTQQGLDYMKYAIGTGFAMTVLSCLLKKEA